MERLSSILISNKGYNLQHTLHEPKKPQQFTNSSTQLLPAQNAVKGMNTSYDTIFNIPSVTPKT